MKMRFVSLAGGGDHEILGQYLVSYDPNLHSPSGEYDGGDLRVTTDPAEAADLTIIQARDIYLSGPNCKCHRLRWDGELNRPLTAFSVEIG